MCNPDSAERIRLAGGEGRVVKGWSAAPLRLPAEVKRP